MDLKKTIIIVLIFFLLAVSLKAIFWGSLNQQTNDYTFHYSNANGDHSLNTGIHSEQVFNEYNSLWKWISQWFASNNPEYYMFTLLFFSLIPCLLLLFITKEWISSWFFFSVSAFWWILDYYGVFPQYLAIILLGIILTTKNIYIRIICLFLALLTHKLAIFLLIIYLLIEFLLEQKQQYFPLIYPIVVNKKLLLFQSVPFTLGLNSLGVIAFFLIREFNLFFILLSFIGSFKNKALLYFNLFLFFAGFFELRLWWIFCFTALIGLTEYWKFASNKQKQLILFISVITLIMQLYSFCVLNIRQLPS